MRIFDPCPPCGRQGRPGEGTWQARIQRAAGERPPRARPQRRGSPGPIPNPAVKPAFAESTAAPGCGRAGRRARGGRFSISARRRAPRAPHAPREACGGRLPLRASLCFAEVAASKTSACADMAARLRRPISAPGWLGRRRRMRDIRRSRCRGPARRGVPAGRSFVRALRACSVLRCMRSV